MIALADKGHNSPMSLSDLDVLLSQTRQLGSAQATAKQDRYPWRCLVCFATFARSTFRVEGEPALG